MDEEHAVSTVLLWSEDEGQAICRDRGRNARAGEDVHLRDSHPFPAIVRLADENTSARARQRRLTESGVVQGRVGNLQQ